MIHDYAKLAKPPTTALRKDSYNNFNDEEYKEAFETLNSLLQNSSILQLPDYEKQFILTTDSSKQSFLKILIIKIHRLDTLPFH